VRGILEHSVEAGILLVQWSSSEILSCPRVIIEILLKLWLVDSFLLFLEFFAHFIFGVVAEHPHRQHCSVL
jgi:hypothetical protein